MPAAGIPCARERTGGLALRPSGTRLGLMLMDDVVLATRVMVAETLCVGSSILTTVTTVVCVVEILTGAVYTPFVIIPIDGVSVHVTAVDATPLIVTLNWVDWPPVRDIEEGVNAMPTVGTSVIVALPVLVGSAKLVAVTVTFCWLLIVAGAW